MIERRTIPGDWCSDALPDNLVSGPDVYIESSFCFKRCKSQRPVAVELGKAASVYKGTMFDLGPNAQVSVGDYTLLNAARIICDNRIEIGTHGLISWNVVIMDTFRLPVDRQQRASILVSQLSTGMFPQDARPSSDFVRIGNNVWIGFGVCILPGSIIGDGAAIGAGSVVSGEVAPYTVVAGNPARFIRRLEP